MPFFPNVQQPVAQQNKAINIVCLYGNNIDVYDVNGFVFSASSSSNSIFILLYDLSGVLLNRNSYFHIVGDFRDICVIADKFIHVAAIVESTSNFPIPFYNQQGQIKINLAQPVVSGTEMAFVATYDTDWVWYRSIQNTLNAYPINPTVNVESISSINLLNINTESLLFNVCSGGNLQLYNGEQK